MVGTSVILACGIGRAGETVKTQQNTPFAKPAALAPQAVAAIKKKLRGKFSYNSKTGEISLQYDWSSKNQLLDFDLGDTEPTLAEDGLAVPAGGVLRHVMEFQGLAVMVPVLVPSMQGTPLKTSGGLEAKLGGGNPDTIFLSDSSETKGMIVPDDQRKGIQWIHVIAAPSHLEFVYGDRSKPSRLGLGVTNFHAGSLELWGGNLGFQYGPLVLTGKMDRGWVARFAAAKK